MLNDQISFDVIYRTGKHWNLEYPGFCALRAEGDKVDPFFIAGTGIVTQSSSDVFLTGSKVLFFGFAETESKSYTASANCVIRIKDDAKQVPDDIAVRAQMIYAVSMLSSEAGMRLYIDKNIPDLATLLAIVDKCGCKAETEFDPKVLYDGAIVAETLPESIRMTASACSVSLNGNGTSRSCDSLGQDFPYYKYMVEGCKIPEHFITEPSCKHFETALSFADLLETANGQAGNDDSATLSTTFAERMKKEFDGHINPGALSISVLTEDTGSGTALACGLAGYIVGKKSTKVRQQVSGDNIAITISYPDGTIATCFVIRSSRKGVEAELHFDNTSISFGHGRFEIYKGSAAEIGTLSGELIQTDISSLIQQGKGVINT